MDKQTLSNYGWIVVCVLVLATLLAFASPFSNFLARGFEATSAGFAFTSDNALTDTLDTMDIVPSLEELQKKHKFEYYSSLALAVDDINADTIGKNADVDKEHAVAGIYVYKGMPYAVLLKDNKEERQVVPSADMTINLGGNTLSSAVNRTMRCEKGNIVIDGRLEGSTIYNNLPNGKCLTALKDTNIEIKAGVYILENINKPDTIFSSAITIRGKAIINNATIVTSGKTNVSGICTRGSYADLTINNTTIDVYSQEDSAVAVSATGILNINSCTITAKSLLNEDRPNMSSIGISIKDDDNEFLNTIIVNVSNSKINVTSNGLSTMGIEFSRLLENPNSSNPTKLNLYNTSITATSKGYAYGIFDNHLKNQTLNIDKCDIIAESHSNVADIVAYGIKSYNYINMKITNSTILANKNLTERKNSIGISAPIEANVKNTTIFGTKYTTYLSEYRNIEDRFH